MSTEQLATFSSSSAPQSVPNLASKNLTSSQQSSPQSTSSPTLAGPSTWQSTPAQKNPRSKARTSEENEITKATAAKFASRLAEDHSAVLDPDVDTPFIDSVDVVKRLLPYHIFLNPVEDLKPLVTDRKGKSKAEELRTENAGKSIMFLL
ncbi:hypothetical protein PM082_000930 [Marasmius tenuissimus]|nr:hypothetical protein PM082_000930 [Marasmius tenuissimus]